MAIKRSKYILDKPDAKNWLDLHECAAKLFFKAVEILTEYYSGSDDGYINITPPQYRFNRHPFGLVAAHAQVNKIIIKFHPTPGEAGRVFYVKNTSDFSIVIDHIKNTHGSYAGFFYPSKAHAITDIINPAPYNNIREYRELSFLRLCARAYLVTGTAENDKFNREQLAKNKTGRWLIAAGRVNFGDAIFLLLPNPNTRNGYPRDLYAGVINKLDVIDGRALFSVNAFVRLPNINARVREFLGGRVSPMGNTVLEIWDISREKQKLYDDFSVKVTKASNDSHENRKARLEKAPRLPARKIVQVEIYDRNPDVVAEVLYQAKGICARCKKPAPFIRRNKSPYLEVHHKVQLASGGEDTVENAIALCPNCHRECHYS